MVAPLRHDDFAPHVGKPFHFEGWRGALHLAKIDLHPLATMPGTTRTPFTAIFHGPADEILAEGLYRATVEDGPSLEFHIMPIHTVTPGRQDYQAVFN
jgi:hypothetical protein